MLINRHLAMLGMKVQDKVTGFRGVVTSISIDLYGCIQALVHPGMDKEKMLDQAWFDVGRLSVVGKAPVMERPNHEYGPQAEGKKGPAEKPRFTKA